MAVQNTKELSDFCVGQEISDEKAEEIKKVIEAFSEYIVAVNPNYVYNKTYLGSYVEQFILCQKELCKKNEIMKKLITKVLVAGWQKDCSIYIDRAWIYKKEELKLNNSLNPEIICSSKMQVEIEFIHDNGFVIVEEFDFEKDHDEQIEKIFSLYVARRKEVLKENEKK